MQNPPHCPIDSTVIETLVKNGAKHLKDIKWTKMNIEDYKKIIKDIEKTKNDLSIAEWELLLFNNRK